MGEAKSPMEVNQFKWDQINDPPNHPCVDCRELFRLGELECNICESCWKKRDQIESMETK